MQACRVKSWVGWLLVMALFPAVSGAGEPKASAAEQEFEKRLKDYLKLRKDVESKAPRLKDKAEPEEIERYEQALAAGIVAARSGARVGDLLGPVQQRLRNTIRQDMRGAQGRGAREKAAEENPEADGQQRVKIAVNAIYPEAQPVSGMPADLLQKLPALPKELEYRFVGRDLILLDAKTRVILDYLKDVTP
jgi:hypothetical protein